MAVHQPWTRRRGPWGKVALLLVATLLASACAGGGTAAGNDGEEAGSIPAPPGLIGCQGFAADGATTGGDAGVPAVRLPCLTDGTEVRLDDLGSRPALVNLWASWCAPCREEMPLLQKAHEQYGQQIGFLGVNTDDTRSAAVSFLTDFGVTYAQVVDTDKQLLKELAAPGLPVTLAVAADGRVIDRQIGQMSADRLNELVNELIAAADSTATG